MRLALAAIAVIAAIAITSARANDISFEVDEHLFNQWESTTHVAEPSFLDDLWPMTQESIRNGIQRDEMEFPFPETDKQPFTFCIASAH